MLVALAAQISPKLKMNGVNVCFAFLIIGVFQRSVAIAEAKNSGCVLDIISSGGIQTSLDIAKSIALGANVVGVAGYFLKILIKGGMEDLLKEVNLIHEELSIIMTALGAKTIEELQQVPLIISGKTHHWLQERNIDTKQYSLRNIHN